MQTIRVRTTQNVFIHYPIASIGDRIVAFVLDRIFVTVYCVAVVAALVNASVEAIWVYLIFVGFPYFFYNLFFEIFMDGQTPGKRLTKIKVVRLDGTQPSIGDYLLRWIFGLIEQGVIAMIVIAVNGKGQRLGDLVAGTSVVKLVEPREITASDIFITAEETYSPVFTEVVRLSQQDIDIIQRALEAYQRLDNMEPVLVVTERIKSLLTIQTDLSPTEFLYTVIKDFNHLNSRP